MVKELRDKIVERYFGKSKYKRNIFMMTVGRISAQAIPILLTPIITRIYLPGEFGIFGVYSTIVAIISMVSNGRYCLAIILPKRKEDAQSIFFASSLFTILITILFALFILFFGDWFFSILNAEILSGYKGILILNVVFIGLFEALYYWLLRNKRYKTIAIGLICQALVLTAVKIGLGYAGFTESGLMIAYLLGYAVAYFFLLLRSDVFRDASWNSSRVKGLLKRYVDFPRFSLLADTLRYLTMMSPNIFLNKMFGSAQAGYYAMTDKVLASPIWLVTSSVTDVFKQEAAEQYREKGSSFDIFFKTTKSLFLLGIIPFLLIFFLSPYFVPIFFGDGWGPVSSYIQIFTLMYFARFVIGPVMSVLYIVNKQKINVIFQGLKLFVIAISFGVGYYLNNLMIGLIIWSLLTVLVYLVIYVTCYKIVKNAKYEDFVEGGRR